MLKLTLFGGFSVAAADGTELAVRSKKARAMLAYLARSPHLARSREEIMALLWSDRGEAQARASLRQLLVGLRKDLGPEADAVLQVDNERIALDGERLTVAAAQPGEEFLAGFHLHDPAFEDWLRDERLRSEARAPAADVPAAPALPDKPSIAVLPFVNNSPDPDQAFFADGITDDIVTALSKIGSLLVVAGVSTSAYKGRAVDVKQVSAEQGVRYVLEGSIRKAGGRVRVMAQLIDAEKGHHIWADRYDRDLNDIFAVQDEITREVVIAVDVHLSAGEHARIWSGGTKNLEAWECIRRANDLIGSGPKGNLKAGRRLCERALELDPAYPMAWVTLGWAYHHEVDVGVGTQEEAAWAAALASARDCARKALDLDDGCVDAFALLALCHLSDGRFDAAVEAVERAVALEPNHAENLAVAALVNNKVGRPDRALSLMKTAMRLCPIYPGWFLWALGNAYRLTGDSAAALRAFKEGVARSGEFLGLHVGLASLLGELDRPAEAQAARADILRLSPDFSIATYLKGLHYKDPAEQARFAAGLRKAGLPD